MAENKKNQIVPKVKEIIEPIKSEFKNRDIIQVIVGASILSVPVGFTQETWDLGASLPLGNVLLLISISIFFIFLFTYTHYHKGKIKADPKYQMKNLFKRVFLTYAFSFIIVALLMTIIQAAPWTTDLALAFKRTAIVTFPSSMSAAIADILE